MTAVTCPMPTAHTYNDVKAAYDKARKANPSLTPAAWRKAAAQEMGIPYDEFLAIWKTKGKVPLVPQSTPPVPAMASPGHTMQVLEEASSEDFGFLLDDVDDAIDEIGNGYKLLKDKADYIANMSKLKTDAFTDYASQDFIDNTIAMAKQQPTISQIESMLNATTKNAFVTEVNSMDTLDILESWNGNPHTYAKFVDDMHAWVKKLPDYKQTVYKDYLKLLDDGLTKPAPAVTKKVVTQEYKQKAVAQKYKTPTPVAGATEAPQVMTIYGPLDHNLAKNTYKMMKEGMPGASPAQLRKAAAQHLGVDYNDYLKAWKAKPTAPTSSIDVGVIKDPPLKDPMKYKDIAPTHNSLKDDLATLYGPKAEKAFINITETSPGTYITHMPTSILSDADMIKVAKEMNKLGLKVTKQGNKLTIKGTNAASQKAAQSVTQQIKSTHGYYTTPDGQKLWDLNSANQWSHDWWQTLSSAQQTAVKRYTGSAYTDMNRFLRGQTSRVSTVNKKYIDNLSSAMVEMDHEFTVFRGARSMHGHDFKPNTFWQDDGFMSTAVTKGSGWSGEFQFEVEVTKGTKGMYVDPYSSNKGEKEFLLDKGTRFRVVSVTRSGGTTFIKLVTLP